MTFAGNSTIQALANANLPNNIALGAYTSVFNTNGYTLTLSGSIGNSGAIDAQIVHPTGGGTLVIAGPFNLVSTNNDTNNPALFMNTSNETTTITGGGTLSGISMGWNGTQNTLTFASTGTITLTNVNNPDLDVGQNGGNPGAGVVNQTTGSVVALGNFSLGKWDGGYGAYNMSGGTLTVLNIYSGGNGNNNGNSIFNQSGGMVNVNGVTWVGQNAGANLLHISNGAYNQTGSLIANLGGGTDVITVTGGSLTLSNGTVTVSNNAAGSGILNLAGGVVQANMVTGTGTSIVNFNGGDFQASPNVNATAPLSGLSSINVFSGGGTIDNNGQNITIGPALLGASGSGVSSIAVSSGGSGYVGVPLVTISGGGGSGATAEAVVINGVVTAINVTNPGTGYTAAPTVTLSYAGANIGVTAATIGASTLTTNTAGAMSFIGTGTTTLTNPANSFVGTSVVGGVLQINVDGDLGAANGGVTLNGGVLYNAGGATIATARTITLGANGGYLQAPYQGNWILNVPVNGAGGLGINWDSGVVTLAATSSYQGNTTIGTMASGFNSAGNPTLQLGINNALPFGTAAGNVVFGPPPGSNTATLDLNGYNAEINGLVGGANTLVDNVSAGGSITLTLGNNNATASFGGVIQNSSGTLSLIKVGSGTQTLGGMNPYSGPTNVYDGTLALNNPSSNNSLPRTPSFNIAAGAALDVTDLGGGTLNLNAAQTLSGGGTVKGNVAAGGATIIPGSLTSIGTLTVGSLDLSGGASLSFVLGKAGSSAASPGLGSSINVNGNLTLPSFQISGFNILNNSNANGQGSLGSGYYDLFNYTGTLNGNPTQAFGSGSGAKQYSFSTVSGATNELLLQISILSLNWTGQDNGNGATDSAWNTTSTNWANGSTPAAYADGAVVTFGDTNPVTGHAVANSSVVLNSTFAPTSITFSNSAVNYTISGGGGITGATGITLNGTGMVSLQTANSFTSPVSINAGVLNVTNAAALGNASGVTVASGAALQLQGNVSTSNAIPLALNGGLAWRPVPPGH